MEQANVSASDSYSLKITFESLNRLRLKIKFWVQLSDALHDALDFYDGYARLGPEMYFLLCNVFSQNDHGTSISHKFQVNSACKGAKITKCEGLPLLFLCIHAPRLSCKQLEHVFWRMYSFSNFVISRISFKLLIKNLVRIQLWLLCTQICSCAPSISALFSCFDVIRLWSLSMNCAQFLSTKYTLLQTSKLLWRSKIYLSTMLLHG